MEEAEKNIADIEAAMVVADLIDALPEEITLDDKPLHLRGLDSRGFGCHRRRRIHRCI